MSRLTRFVWLVPALACTIAAAAPFANPVSAARRRPGTPWASIEPSVGHPAIDILPRLVLCFFGEARYRAARGAGDGAVLGRRPAAGRHGPGVTVPMRSTTLARERLAVIARRGVAPLVVGAALATRGRSTRATAAATTVAVGGAGRGSSPELDRGHPVSSTRPGGRDRARRAQPERHRRPAVRRHLGRRPHRAGCPLHREPRHRCEPTGGGQRGRARARGPTMACCSRAGPCGRVENFANRILEIRMTPDLSSADASSR